MAVSGTVAHTADLKVRVLGCSGSIAAGCRTSSFLVDDALLFDAGTGVGDLPHEDIARIDHIFLTHSHLDHVLGVGLLADTGLRLRMAAQRPPVQVYALRDTLKALREHIFNGVIWPDFTVIPSAEQPALAFVEVTLGQRLEVAGRRIEVLPAVHTVPAVGYAVSAGAGRPAWVYTGDTGPNPALWQRLRAMTVAHLVIETAFSDEERQLAEISRHLCPTALGQELAQLSGSVDVRITHIKPGEMDAVMSEIGRLRLAHKVCALSAGDDMRLV